MDFTLIEKRENGGLCYKLLKTNFYRNYYVIIAQSKESFACGSIGAALDVAKAIFDDIADSYTEPYALSDILCDLNKRAV